MYFGQLSVCVMRSKVRVTCFLGITSVTSSRPTHRSAQCHWSRSSYSCRCTITSGSHTPPLQETQNSKGRIELRRNKEHYLLKKRQERKSTYWLGPQANIRLECSWDQGTGITPCYIREQESVYICPHWVNDGLEAWISAVSHSTDIYESWFDLLL